RRKPTSAQPVLVVLRRQHLHANERSTISPGEKLLRSGVCVVPSCCLLSQEAAAVLPRMALYARSLHQLGSTALRGPSLLRPRLRAVVQSIPARGFRDLPLIGVFRQADVEIRGEHLAHCL